MKGIIAHLHHMQDEYFPIGFGRVLPESMLASYGVVSTKDVNDPRTRTRLQGSYTSEPFLLSAVVRSGPSF